MLAQQSSLPLLIVALTMAAAYRALDHAQAVVADIDGAGTLAAALAAVVTGGRYQDPMLDAPFAGSGLSAVEKELVFLLLRGWQTDAIIRQLKLQPQTVREYRSRIYAKLAVSDLEQLRDRVDTWRHLH